MKSNSIVPNMHTTKTGTVVSNKMDKTIVVAVELLKKHRLYKKTYTYTQKFYAHDFANACDIGDIVTIAECRPLSKTKHWQLLSINKKGAQSISIAQAAALLETMETTTAV